MASTSWSNIPPDIHIFLWLPHSTFPLSNDPQLSFPFHVRTHHNREINWYEKSGKGLKEEPGIELGLYPVPLVTRLPFVIRLNLFNSCILIHTMKILIPSLQGECADYRDTWCLQHSTPKASFPQTMGLTLLLLFVEKQWLHWQWTDLHCNSH